MTIEILEFDFAPLRYNCPKGFTSVSANKNCLLFYRSREFSDEKFAVAKTGENEFSLFRVNITLAPNDGWFEEKNRVCVGDLAKILAMIGYKTRPLTKTKR